ncbi:hypothetical protein [Nocardia tengchongensis]
MRIGGALLVVFAALYIVGMLVLVHHDHHGHHNWGGPGPRMGHGRR